MDFDSLRKKMVQEQLIARDITDQKVLQAFLKVPRHKFVPPSEQSSAYGDFPLPIGSGQTISQPYMVALMTQCLRLTGAEKVLEIGTGSGYQAAILAELAKDIYTIERVYELSQKSEKMLTELGYKNIYFKVGDGSLGWKANAPFDAIIVTAGAPRAPQPLLEQLAEGGRLVIPIGGGLSQVLTVFTRTKSGIQTSEFCGCMFVPLVGEEGWRE
jgi:protein-L-isoaspartate(D-aspartate) O-methyltransferase